MNKFDQFMGKLAKRILIGIAVLFAGFILLSIIVAITDSGKGKSKSSDQASKKKVHKVKAKQKESSSTQANAKPEYVAKVGKHKIYKVNIQTVSEDNNSHNWILKGTTKAPDKAKIVIIPSDNTDILGYDNGSESENEDHLGWPKVKKGKVDTSASPESLSVEISKKAGQKANVLVFAITNTNTNDEKTWENPDITTVPKKIVSAVKNSIRPCGLTISQAQANYDADINKKSKPKGQKGLKKEAKHYAKKDSKNKIYDVITTKNNTPANPGNANIIFNVPANKAYVPGETLDITAAIHAIQHTELPNITNFKVILRSTYTYEFMKAIKIPLSTIQTTNENNISQVAYNLATQNQIN